MGKLTRRIYSRAHQEQDEPCVDGNTMNTIYTCSIRLLQDREKEFHTSFINDGNIVHVVFLLLYLLFFLSCMHVQMKSHHLEDLLHKVALDLSARTVNIGCQRSNTIVTCRKSMCYNNDEWAFINVTCAIRKQVNKASND
jgi:hypothetical protein